MTEPRFFSSKTYGHDLGLSCAFRQWRADSHCRFLHGYALAVHLEFTATGLDRNGWVMDFGSLGGVKRDLIAMFDHKTLVAEDDPAMEWFRHANDTGVLQLRIVPATGCEAFALQIAVMVADHLRRISATPRVRLSRVEVREHAANAAAMEF